MLTNSLLLGITTDYLSSKYSMTQELQSTLQHSGIEWPALSDHIPCIAHVTHLALGAFRSSLSVKGHTKCCEAHECDQQFGENESLDIGKSQRVRKEGSARISRVSAMRPGLAKIIENVSTSRSFESPETDLHNAENACCIKYAITWSSKRTHWLSNSQCPHRSFPNYGCEDTMKLDTRVAWARLPITRIHLCVAQKSRIQRLLDTIPNTGGMDHCQLCHGSIEANLILDPVYVELVYSQIASRYYSIHRQVRSYGWHYVNCG